MRTPSDSLLQALFATGLCSRSDIEACELPVRRLCRDLPDFDSVWLDVLVQRRVLTPWQADRLSAGESSSLMVGSYLLREPLGTHAFLAERRQVPRTSSQSLAPRMPRRSARECRMTTDFVVLASLVPADRMIEHSLDPDGRTSDARGADSRLFPSAASVPSCLALPASVVEDGFDREATMPLLERSATSGPSPLAASRQWLVSPFVAGWTLRELLIRGGRFPWSAVAEIGRDLLQGLAWLESKRLIHGAITLSNVVLRADGTAVLVNAFARAQRQPTLLLSTRLTLDGCEGVAPEQFGSGRIADERSELYALGCVLWQLLTGRPVVLHADPVARMLKLAEQDIADVRTYAPDCPDWLVRALHSLTRRAPELRPSTAGDVLKVWEKHVGTGHRAAKRIVNQMPDRSARTMRPRRRFDPLQASTPNERRLRPLLARGRSLVWPITATGVLAALVIVAAQSGVVPRTLRFGRTSSAEHALESDAASGATSAAGAGSAHGDLMPLIPEPGEDGVVRLTGGHRYRLRSIAAAMRLRIESSGDQPAEILVSPSDRCDWSAPEVELQGLLIRQDQSSGESATADSAQLVTITSTRLQIDRCHVQAPSAGDRFAGITWQLLSASDSIADVRDSVFSGGGYGLSLARMPQRVACDNVLFVSHGGALLVEVLNGDADTLDLMMTNVTQRFGFSLADVVVHEDGPSRLHTAITSQDSVYEPRMAILRLQTPSSWTTAEMQVAFKAGESGNPAIVPPDIQPAVWVDPTLHQPVALPDSQFTSNEILLAELLFRSADDATSDSPWSPSVLEDFEGPKLTTTMPGIDATRLP